jgi:hypothetical protein
MNCPGSERIMALIDSELSPEEQASVREHIAGCSSCRRLIEKQKLIEDTWRESYVSPSDFEFNAFEKKLTNKLFRRSWVRTVLPVAAAFVAVLLGVRIFIMDGPSESLLQRIPGEPVSPAVVVDEMISDGDSLNETISEHAAESAGEREEIVQEEYGLRSSSDLGTILPDVPAAAGEDIDSLDRVLNAAGAAVPDDEMQSTHSEQEAGTVGLIDGYASSGAEPLDEGAAAGEICPDTDPTGFFGIEAGRSISTVESLSLNYTAGNVETASDAAAFETPVQSDETVVAGGSGGGAGGAVGYGYTENVEQSADDGSTAAECIETEAVAQSAPEGTDYMGETYRDDVVVFAAVAALSEDTLSLEECPASDVEAGPRSVMLVLGSDTRYRSDDVSSALELIEQELQMDWNRKSVPLSTLLPVLISISFRIAPDGTVYDVSVTAPPDSFLSDILPELEERIATLRFEETDDTLDTVMLEVVLF